MLAVVPVLLFAAVSAHAQGPKPCEELKAEIVQKLDAKGVKGYSLEIVAKDAEVTDGKVVGTCGGGTKKIIYRKTSTPPPAPAPEAAKP
ncbi:MAG: DUF1161 domain-containing protein [Candidatus Acidiferrales bacterium]|jgi:hypothetical protein